MARLLRNFFQLQNQVVKKAPLSRSFTTTKRILNNYEGDGKTTVTILNREYKHLVLLDSFSNYGFRLNNGIFVIGPMAIFPRTVLQWNVNDIEDLTPESLSLFTLLEPKLDIFILGTGDQRRLPKPEVLAFLESKKIFAEILSTENACATFNFLNVEGRCVAAAFIPPTNVTVFEDDLKFLQEVKDDAGLIS